MADSIARSGRRPSPGRSSKAVTVLALAAAVAYWVLFSPGWGFLVAAVLVVGLLYVLPPYVRAAL